MRDKLLSVFKRVHVSEVGIFGISTALFLMLMFGAAGLTWWFLDTDVFDGDGESGQMEYGESEVREYVSFGVWWSSEKYSITTALKDMGPVFICPDTITITSVDFHVGYCSGSTSDGFRARFYEWDDVEELPGELVGESAIVYANDFPGYCWGSDDPVPVVTWSFDDDVVLMEDAEYILMFDLVVGPGSSVNWRYQPEIGTEDEVTIGYVSGGDDYYDDRTIEYWVTGYKTQTPEVVTVGSEIRDDGSVWLSGWCDVVSDSDVGFLVSDVESVVTAGQGVRYECGSTGVEESRHTFNTRVVSVLSGVTYYYRAYCEVDGQYYYGSVKSFQRLASDILPGLTCENRVSDIDLVEFATGFIDVPDETSWNISIVYGRTMCEFESGNYSLSVGLNVDADGSWRTEVSPSVFDGGQRYFFRAKALEAEGSSVYSETDTFVVYDAGQPGFINWFAGLTGISFEWLWWAFALVGLAGIWLLAGWTKWWWLGIIGTAVFCVAMISFGYLNAWIVVLLAIIAGWIIFKVVFKYSGGTHS